jgi:hypothetical protein
LAREGYYCIGHLAAWEVACVLSLRAYQQGKDYQSRTIILRKKASIGETTMNAAAMPADQVYEE